MSTKNTIEVTQNANARVLKVQQVAPQGAASRIIVARMYKYQGRAIMTNDNILIRATNNHGQGVQLRLIKNPNVRTRAWPIIVGEEGKVDFAKEITWKIFLQDFGLIQNDPVWLMSNTEVFKC